MINSRDKCSLVLQVKDFGPIADAKLDLRNFNVFVGPSNTGKSYLAILIYALLKNFRDNVYSASVRYGMRNIYNQDVRSIVNEIYSLNKEVLHNTYNQNSHFIVTKNYNRFLDQYLFKSNDTISNEIYRCFGINSEKQLRRKSSKVKPKIGFKHINYDGDEISYCNLVLGNNYVSESGIKENYVLKITKNEFVNIQKIFRNIHQLGSTNTESDIDRTDHVYKIILRNISDVIIPYIVQNYHQTAYYVPADRTGVMHSHNVIVRALISNASTAGIFETERTPSLSGVLADFLQDMIRIDDFPSGRPRHGLFTKRNTGNPVGKNIEKNILGGSIRINKQKITGYPNITFRPDGWDYDLQMSNSSSMISELAPIVLYLHRIASREDILIIEEPESHLHPGMQVELTRQLAEIVKFGIKVIVTTHSEWLLDELTNIVRRSEVRLSDQAMVSLKPEEVGVWHFQQKRRPIGTVLRELKLNEHGFYQADYDSVALDLHNAWADIVNQSENQN